jgi:hypothetical protein
MLLYVLLKCVVVLFKTSCGCTYAKPLTRAISSAMLLWAIEPLHPGSDLQKPKELKASVTSTSTKKAPLPDNMCYLG